MQWLSIQYPTACSEPAMVDIGLSQYLVRRAFIWDPSHFPIYEDPPNTSAHVGDNPDLVWDNLVAAMK